MRHIILIPAYKPEYKLVRLVEELMLYDFNDIIVVDDGSGEEYGDIFECAKDYGAVVVRHDRNLGKGEAIKTGIRAAVMRYDTEICVITADADGQHRPADIAWVSNALDCNPGTLVLGTRCFDGADVPKRSRFGNRMTSKVFKLMTGVDCADTQTGLRGIPALLLDLALETPGTRYEYEMNFLEAAAAEVSFTEVSIETVYEDGNKCSHFRPVRDSLRVYGRPIRFACASLASAAVDYGLFALLLMLAIPDHIIAVIIATVGARLVSGVVNFLLNRYYSFKSRGAIGDEAVKYGTLFIIQMIFSAWLTAFVSVIIGTSVGAKLIVDTLLFVASYVIQRRCIFVPARKSRQFEVKVTEEDKEEVKTDDRKRRKTGHAKAPHAA